MITREAALLFEILSESSFQIETFNARGKPVTRVHPANAAWLGLMGRQTVLLTKMGVGGAEPGSLKTIRRNGRANPARAKLAVVPGAKEETDWVKILKEEKKREKQAV